jgi:urea transport system permease protein
MQKILQIAFLNLLFSFSLFANFETDIKPLTENSFLKKENTVEKLVSKYSENEKLHTLLKAMLDGELYYSRKEFVVLKDDEVTNLLGEKLERNRKIFKKVKTNNKLRSVIRNRLSQLNLFSKDVEIRFESAKNIRSNLEKDSIPLIEKALKFETDSSVKDIHLESEAILKARFGNFEEKKIAVQNLGDFLSPEALQVLKEIEAEGGELSKLASKSIASIESSRSFFSFLETIFFGLSQGSVLLLAAMGLAITFGVMKVINMAHGEMMMIGAYTAFTIQQIFPNLIEYSILLAIPLAFLVSGIFGVIIERLVIKHLYGRPLETLLATFGISLLLQQLVRTIYSPLNQNVETPEWMSGALEINSALALTYNRLYIIIFAFLVFLGVLLLLKKSSLGLKVRAVTQNREMAKAMGIKTGYIDAITFGIGSGIAGVAGVALSQLTNVGPNLGQAYIVDSFMVVVFGGVGNLWGTLIGAVSLGEINKFIEPVAGAVLAKVIILIFIILFIQKRPKGLFPQKGREE